MKTVGLVLQGGAALGAYEWGVIDRVIDSGWTVEIVSGVSIGAVNASVLCSALRGKANPKQRLQAVWSDIEQPITWHPFNVLYDPGLYSPHNPFLMYWYMSFASMAPLANTLQKHINFSTELSKTAVGPRLLVTATNLATGELDVFDSQKMNILPEHILASGSLPPGYGPTQAHDVHQNVGTYVDGGLYNNTPLKQVIDALEAAAQKVDKLIVVKLFPSAGPVPKHNPVEYADRLFEIFFSEKTDKDANRAIRVRQLIDLYNTLYAILPAKDLLALEKKFPEAFKYLKKPAVFDDVIVLENKRPVPLTGPADFTASAVTQRRNDGYSDAQKYGI
jgi:NTE family protein